ncbi:MAG: sulfur carrier protein ThiS [Paludibacteraceae bacterium]|nr:sulfur carrier protein ThiS [Paludibacteraceae bacterium]
MKIWINDRETVTDACNLGQLADQLQLPSNGVAVAVNNQMAPRAQWNATALAEGDRVVVIKAACGG